MVPTPPPVEETFSRELKGESVGRTTSIPRPSMQTGQGLSLSGGYRDRRTLTIPEVQEEYPQVPRQVSFSGTVPTFPLTKTTNDIAAAVGIGTGGTGGSAFYQFIYNGAIALGQSPTQAQASAVAILTPFQTLFGDFSVQDNDIGTVVNGGISG